MKGIKSNTVFLVTSYDLKDVAMTQDAYNLYKKILYRRDVEDYLSHSAIKVKKDLLLCSEYEILDVEDIKNY
jgi:hypothetical protein